MIVKPHCTILTFGAPGDLSLSQKLHEELKFEQESAAEDAYSPAFLEAFKEDGVWNVCLSICEVFLLLSKV
jgi:hypothetical protein